ncbi:molecular chaperone DnaJ [Porphyrobacter sp. AAP60]|uniref:molecular chaperone DnaJ n=1 Tax=Porphyrobacter sp. AAP60 TaxID=1523423 RepID=UPI0006B964B0|nr:molecular chaperone DnaJ [Porphyrobacter sp. AAP60]KPF63627.1 molecular chaperone DnaJ [Porphyrobacter sp. AAP60]
MLVRALILIVAVCVLCRWGLGKWPWEYLRSVPVRQQAIERARNLLGVNAAATRDDVISAHRRLTALVHPDRGGTTAAMQEANAARDLLLANLPAAPLPPDEGNGSDQSRD